MKNTHKPFVEAANGESVKFRGNLSHAASMSRISAGHAVAGTASDSTRTWLWNKAGQFRGHCFLKVSKFSGHGFPSSVDLGARELA